MGLTNNFFEDLTSTLVAKAGENSDPKNVLQRLQEALNAVPQAPTSEHYLYADNYIMHLEKLIPEAQQQKLREAFGDEWLAVVNGIYKQIEREVHDELLKKLSSL